MPMALGAGMGVVRPPEFRVLAIMGRKPPPNLQSQAHPNMRWVVGKVWDTEWVEA